MVKNTIKVYGRIKRYKSKSSIRNYDIRKVRDFEEIAFNTDMSGDYGFYKNSKHRFRFCTIFDESTTQSDVFDSIAKPVVNNVLEGYNGTIFAYGQTGSGKTFSMTGASEYETRGIIPRTIQHIFEYIRNSSTILYNIYISYLEIYNEMGYDLLNPRHRATYLEDLPRVTILEDAKGQTHLRNLGVISVASEREAMCLLFLGDTNRTIAETPMNMYSSRSHCIFTVHVAATMTEDGRVRRSKLHLVDLAGSERIHKSGISGTLLVDAKQINLSLHYLEQVIIALSDEKRAHVPYRNSLMTSVLKDSLGGNCLTAMLATMSMDPRNFEETISTCKFAQRVALVSSEAHINEEEDPEIRIDQLKLEIENLRKELVLYKDSSALRFRIKENRELSPEQIKECEKQVSLFIRSPSDIFQIEDDMNKIQAYFKVFKNIIQSQMELINNDKPANKSLSDIIKKKDNEISILVHLLNKEKLKTKEAERNNISIAQNSCPEVTMNCGSSLSEKEAFQMFLRNDKNASELNKCASALKQKIAQAKNVANRIKMCKNNIVSLKVKLRENINNTPEVSNKLMTQLKSQQDIYRENIIQLRNLKTETDHLSHAFHQEKVRTTKRFQNWWTNENVTSSAPQIPGASTFPEATHLLQNAFSADFQPQDNISLNSEQFVPHLSPRNHMADFTIDTFPSVYDNETNFIQQFEDLEVSPETNYTQPTVSSLNSQPFQNDFQYSNSTSNNSNNYVPPTINDYQTNRISTTNYMNQSPTPSSNGIKKPSSQKFNNYYSENAPKQFAPIPQVSNHYTGSGHQNNVQYQYSVPQSQPSFSGNYNHYPENNQSNFMDYDLPEKLSNNTEMYSGDNNSYYRYYSMENQSSMEQTVGEDIHSQSNVKITVSVSEVKRNSVEEDKTQEYYNSIPLTGDPEVDEEILAFYRAKQNVFNGNNK